MTLLVLGSTSFLAKRFVSTQVKTVFGFSRNKNTGSYFWDAEDSGSDKNVLRILGEKSITEQPVILFFTGSMQAKLGPERLMTINAGGPLRLAEKILSDYPEAQIIFMGSVAGIRGRSAVGFYSAAKAALHAGAEVLLQRYRAGTITVIVPGSIKSPASAGATTPDLLQENPEIVLKTIFRAIEKQTSGFVYSSTLWLAISIILRLIPGRIFRHLTF